MRPIAAVPIDSRVISNHNLSVGVRKREIHKNKQPAILYFYQRRRCSVLYLWLSSQCWHCQVFELEEKRHPSVPSAETPHAAADGCTLNLWSSQGLNAPCRATTETTPKTFIFIFIFFTRARLAYLSWTEWEWVWWWMALAGTLCRSGLHIHSQVCTCTQHYGYSCRLTYTPGLLPEGGQQV